MFLRFCLGVALLFGLTGCATVRKSSVDQLEMRVARLEESLSYKDDEIRNLKLEVQDMERQMGKTGTKAKVASSSSISATKKTGVVRVDASTEKIQKALKNAGFYQGPIDGKIGDGTKSAIAEFQKAHNLKVDGIIGSQTWQELSVYIE